MPLEPATLISDLDQTLPAHTDQINQGDGHVRLLKSTLKNTFPNVTTPLATSAAQIDAVLSLITVSHGQLRGPGLPRCGAFVDFPVEPPTRFTKAGAAAGGQAAVDHIECDGAVYNVTDFPDLGAFLGATYGGNGTTTFGMPGLTDTGRFRRSRTATNAVGTKQANQNVSHQHTGGTDLAGVDHAHAYSGYTDTENALHTHTVTDGQFVGSNSTAAGPNPPGGSNSTTTETTSTESAVHQHFYSGVTGGASGYLHAHSFTTAASGGTEARPENIAVVVCIKT